LPAPGSLEVAPPAAANCPSRQLMLDGSYSEPAASSADRPRGSSVVIIELD
jgi:hypothetical protein